MKTKVLVIVGPTASGKSSLAVEAAKRFNGEIISADSMQIYKNMNIATAKPSSKEMQGIKHYLIDFLDTDKEYSVGQFVIDAENAVNQITAKNKLPIICGGTGLYIDSLINGYNFTDNSTDENIRSELNSLYISFGVDYLLNILGAFDSESAEKLSTEKNPKRIIRAIEFYKTTGTAISQQNIRNKSVESKYSPFYIGLTASDRQFIYDRINARVDIMIQNGLVKEAEIMLNSDLSATSSGAIGYKQLKPYFNSEAALDECIERIKIETRHYAKRQLTWFKRNDKINWINIDEYKTSISQLDYIDNKIRGFLNGQTII